ncbi:MAG: glutamate--tRNA ligase family protein, partial [Phycisphaerales bacterium]
AAHLPPDAPVTRLAPSPTGGLHLGNAFAFLINWAMARKHGWRIVLRIEDLDRSRVKPGGTRSTIRTLEWLGLDWDSGPTTQADDSTRYRQAMQTLAEHGLVYPCRLTRSQIQEAASAPHPPQSPADGPPHETRFDPALRPSLRPDSFNDTGANWRFVVEPGETGFIDRHMGPQRFDIDAISGDFVVWTKRAAPSYQLAVVVDDALAGVNRVVRGNDLLDSAARQLLLYRALSLGPEPEYFHLPLIRGPDGHRLAKRHGDTRIESLANRDAGPGPERVIGLIARWCGITPKRTPMSAAEFLDGFSLDRLGTDDIVFTPEDNAWLSS